MKVIFSFLIAAFFAGHAYADTFLSFSVGQNAEASSRLGINKLIVEGTNGESIYVVCNRGGHTHVRSDNTESIYAGKLYQNGKECDEAIEALKTSIQSGNIDKIIFNLSTGKMQTVNKSKVKNDSLGSGGLCVLWPELC